MDKKECYAILEKVFPINNAGYREVPAGCTECSEKVLCLKQALNSKEGIELRSEVLERAPVSGLLGRIKRWSEKKELSRKKQS